MMMNDITHLYSQTVKICHAAAINVNTWVEKCKSANKVKIYKIQVKILIILNIYKYQHINIKYISKYQISIYMETVRNKENFI